MKDEGNSRGYLLRLLIKKRNQMVTFELYRRSTIGMCLTETLDEMVSSGILGPKLAIQVLVQFDKSMVEALDNQVKTKVFIKIGEVIDGPDDGNGMKRPVLDGVQYDYEVNA
uniref:Transcription initiation factor IIA gamma subunit N-terminal domain-containing protein n=1 Tax=Lactuca sativa TaxID=4236 RepID=A0A9R1W1Y8_LACSA|nr:hypothetical protein LSAT_V11C400180210 [Lactuca sativa]